MRWDLNPKRLYELFVGHKGSHIEWVNNRWVRIFSPLTPHKIKLHKEHEIAVGSYPIYIKDGIDRCKWICLDIDSHKRVTKEEKEEIKKKYPKTWKLEFHKLIKKYKKDIDIGRKGRQRQFCYYLVNHSEDFFKTDSFMFEDSGGGFHIWIFPEPDTPLEHCGRYIEYIKPRILKEYRFFFPDNGAPEIYPKQYSTSHLEEKCGNGVRIPFGKNIGKDYITKVLIDKTGTTDIAALSSLYTGSDVTKIKEDVGKREKDELYDKQTVKGDAEFWYYYPLIRPCYKKIMDGQVQTLDRHGHYMRISMCHELSYHKVPFELIIDSFDKQFDYDPITSREQVESIVRGKQGDWRWSCQKIKDLGYCTEEDCKYEFKKYREGKYKIRF